MRHLLIGALAAAFAFALIGGASGAGAHVSTSPPPFAPRHGGISGIVPAPHSPLRPLPPLGGHDLTYHGGPVMRSNTVYAIYWVPSGYSLPANYAATINQYFTDVAADSGRSTNVYGTDPQYTDSGGRASYDSTFGGSVTDTNSYPADGCADPFAPWYVTKCLTDAQLQAEIQSVVAAHGWARDLHHMYFLFTPSGIDSCFDAGSTECAYNYYCAYHYYIPTASGNIVYANMPFTYPDCDVGEYPNGSSNQADPTINVVSHEHNEAVTDPLVSAWYDDQGYEDGDKCAWIFTGAQGPFGSEYTNTINGHNYWLQLEWDNGTAGNINDGSCVQQVAPKISSFSPTSGPVGTSVTINGWGFNGETSVAFNGTDAVSPVVTNTGTQITVDVPSGATSGPITVTSPGGTGTSASNFTVAVPPSITGFTPPSGPVGTSVTISGTNLSSPTSVTFNGTHATSFVVDSAVQIRATVPAAATSGPIAVTTAGGVATSGSDFTVTAPPPTVGSFSPGSGRVGTIVTVNGTNLLGATSVTFGGVAATPTVLSATQVRATVPADAKTGKIGVTTPGGSALSAAVFKVTPKVTSFGPATAPAGASVTIAGTGFTDVSAVKFGGVAASFGVDSSAQITAVVPASATSGTVSVTTAGGTASSVTAFKAVPTITGFSPGSAAAGSPVVVDGTGFGGVSSVKVNGVAAGFSLLSKIQLRLTVPTAASTGTISVTTVGGTAASAGTLAVLPRVTGFGPTTAPVGTTVTISGNAFGGASSVLFNGVIAVPATVTPTKITVVEPPDASTGKLTVVTGAGSGQSAGTFKVLPKLTSFGPSVGPAGTSVTIAGSGFTDVSAVKFNSAPAGFSADSDHQITATVPASATIGKVSIVTAGGTATSLTNFTVVPTITGFSPGSAAPGSPVMVDGTGFGGVSSAKVNGVAAGFARLSALQVRLTVPASATSGTISITTPGGTAASAGTLAVLPRVTGFTPGSAAVGATLTITGNAFGGATNVLFNGVGAVPATVLPAKITVPVPADASTGKLTVVTAAGPGQSAGTFKVLPKLTSFTPSSGVVGTSVTIAGSGFTDVTAVKFNGHAASTWTRDSSTQITAMVPLGATTGRITVTTAGGTATSATSFTVVP
jgi:large repetitive protein